MPPLTIPLEEFDGKEYIPPPEITWEVAGTGSRGMDCGARVDYVCPHCQKHFNITKSCMLRSCPECAGPWASREAAITKARMERARAEFKTRLHHVVLSFKEAEINGKDEYDRFRKKCYNILKHHGVDGGGLVLHPWREDHNGEFNVEGIHCHAFAVGNWIRPGSGTELDECIIFKRIGELKYYKQYRYVFDHCGVSSRIHSITWFGNMSYRNFPKSAEEKRARGLGRAIECPDCKTELERALFIDYNEQDYVIFDPGG